MYIHVQCNITQRNAEDNPGTCKKLQSCEDILTSYKHYRTTRPFGIICNFKAHKHKQHCIAYVAYTQGILYGQINQHA